MSKRYRLPPSPRVVVTGGGRGIGQAFCLALAPRGARILVADIDEEAAQETATQVRAAGGDAVVVACDVAQQTQVDALAEAMDTHFGGVDLVINNAGVGVAGPIGEVPLDDWRWVMGINLWGVIYGCHVFVPLFKAQGTGMIINVASAAGFASGGDMGPYNVTKAGVISLSETLHQELRDTDVAVTVLAPTFVKTDIMTNMRSTSAELSAVAQQLISREKTTAEAVARYTLKAAERGELYVIPQFLGRAMWASKRFTPNAYGWLMHRIKKSRWFDRLKQPPE